LSNLKTAMVFIAVIMVVKSLAGLFALKIQATLLLPASFAVLSQFMTISGLVVNISSAAITAGMTVLLARADATARIRQLIRTGEIYSAGLSATISIVCVILFFFGADVINIKPLPQYLYLLLAVSPWLITKSSIAQARLTSSYQLNRYTKLSSVSSIIASLLIVVLTFYFGLSGSALAVIIGPIFAAIILLAYVPNEIEKSVTNDSLDIKSNDIYELLRFSAAMLFAVFAVPLSQILVRGNMVDAGAAAQAGFWSASVRLSDVYMQFFGLLLTFYILPNIASKTKSNDSNKVFFHFLGRLSLLAVFVLFIVYALREIIIALILAPEFVSVTGLMKTQLLGDFCRIILSFFFWFSYGQNLRMLAVVEEALQGGLFYALYLINQNSNYAERAVQAHFYASLINMVVIGAILLLILSKRRKH
jgi:O-antigen/teichoic acid export membrane protein